MPRPSIIEQEDVANAVSELRENGKPINPYQIKKLLGQGSEAKIAYYLQAIDINYDLDEEDPLTKRLTNLVRPIAMELNEQKLQQVGNVREEFQHKLKERLDEISELTTKLRDKEKELDRATTDLFEANGKYDTLQAKHERLEEQYNELRLDLIQEKSKNNETCIKLESANTSIAELKERVSKNEATHIETEAELRASHEKTINEKNQRLEALEAELASQKMVNETSNIELATLLAKSAAQEQEIASNAQKILELDSDKSVQAEKMAAKDSELLNAHKNELEQTQQITELDSTLRDQRVMIQELTEQLAESERTVISLKEHNISVSEEKSNLQAQFNVLENVIERLNGLRTQDQA